MTAQEDKVLAVAREVWRKSTPSDERTERAAQRIARRMRISASRPSRRPLGYVAFAIVLIGALAYAASGGLSSERGPRRTVQTPATAPQGQAGTPVVQENKPNSAQRGQEESTPSVEERSPPKSASPASGSAGSSGSSTNGKHKKTEASDPSAAASSWREVDEALGAKDDKRAEKALNGLATSDDATTRAKAKLGLAQLARSQNDCPRASALANEVITMPDVDSVVVNRARVIAKACQ